jgi:FkbM family methyltransferase
MHPAIKRLPVVNKVVKIKDIFLIQLNTILGRIDGLDYGQRVLMENDNSLLQGSIHTIETLKRHNEQFFKNAESVGAQLGELRSKMDEARRNIRTSQYGLMNPEASLMEYLYSYLPSRNAIDVGANIGHIAERLLDAGYVVYAVEPFPEAYQKLQERLSDRPDFHPFQVAVGAEDEDEADLHIATDNSPNHKYKDYTQYSSLLHHSMPEDMSFTSTIKVPVRSLASMQAAGELPKETGLLKIDTEGSDLEVIRGLGKQQPAAVTCEFWDKQFMFGQSPTANRLPELVKEMRSRGYAWHLVIYRVEGSFDISFYCNHSESIEKSWGNVFFFHDREVFRHARDWCAAVLPQTYFCE